MAQKTKTPVKRPRVYWNKKVAKARNPLSWKKSIIEGKAAAPLDPTVVRSLRIRNGISQETMAERMGLSVTTFGDIERAKRPIRNDKAEKLAKELKSSVVAMFTKVNDKKYIAKKVSD